MTWPGSAAPLANQWTAGERVTAVKMNGRVDAQLNAVQSFIQAPPIQTLFFVPGGTLQTPTSGTITWLTLGTITVPVWSSSCFVNYTLNYIADTGTTSNFTAVMNIGSAVGGVSRRIINPAVANQRFNYPVNDSFSGLSTGSQTVVIKATFVAGSQSYADVNSFMTAMFFFSA